jgi:hypothetical protein
MAVTSDAAATQIEKRRCMLAIRSVLGREEVERAGLHESNAISSSQFWGRGLVFAFRWMLQTMHDYDNCIACRERKHGVSPEDGR